MEKDETIMMMQGKKLKGRRTLLASIIPSLSHYPIGAPCTVQVFQVSPTSLP